MYSKGLIITAVYSHCVKVVWVYHWGNKREKKKMERYIFYSINKLSHFSKCPLFLEIDVLLSEFMMAFLFNLH